MQSSPTSPVGTRRPPWARPSASTTTRVLAIGRPTVIDSVWVRISVERRPNRGLGRPVEVPERLAAPQGIRGELPRQCLATAEDLQPLVSLPARGDEELPRRRRGLHDGRPRSVGIVARIDRTASSTTSAFAIATRAPTTRGRKSSRAAMSKEKDVTARSTSSSTRPGSRRMKPKKVRKGTVLDGDPLRLTGRPRRVNDLREVVGAGAGQRRPRVGSGLELAEADNAESPRRRAARGARRASRPRRPPA